MDEVSMTLPAGRPSAAGADHGLWREVALGVVVPLTLIAVILTADAIEGPKTAYVGVLTFVPMLAAVFARPPFTAAVGVVTWLSAFGFGRIASDGNVTAQQVRLVIIAMSIVIATVAAGLRVRGERELAAARLAAAQAEAKRREEHRTLVRQQELERSRRVRSELLRELDERLDGDNADAEALQALVELLVPRFADGASIEAGDPAASERLAVAGVGAFVGAGAGPAGAGGAAAESGELVGDFHAGRAGEVRLRVHRSDPDRTPFDETDRAYLDQFTGRATVALARRDARARQREITAELQRALLPAQLADAPGVEVAATYEAAGAMLDVGGDWYDSIALPDGRLLLVVGDVVGHGLEAAAVMGRMRAGLAALGTRITDPAELLAALDTFADGPDGARYATVVCAVLDPRTGELEYASAGHPPVLVVEPDGTVAWLDAATSPPLASVQPVTRTAARRALTPGTTVVLYSDGLIEARRVDLDTAFERLASTVTAARDRAVGTLCREVVAALAGTGGFTDDVVILAARVGGPAA